MPPDASLLLEKPLLQILSNIVTGAHPPNPAGPSSVLEHFTRTRYSDIIRPEILKEWSGQDHVSSNLTFDVKGTGSSLSEPSQVFCDKVSKKLFEALSAQELAQVTKEYDEEWTMAKKCYEQKMRATYGQFDIERVMYDMPGVLGMILTALETLTNNHLILWAGGAGKQGFGLVSVTSDCARSEKPVYIPETQKIFFEQMARQVMSAQQDIFLSKCAATSALLPSNLFHETPPKSEFLEGSSPMAAKSGATSAQRGSSLLSPILLDHPLLSPHPGNDEKTTPAPPAHSPAENMRASVSPIAEASGANGDEEEQAPLVLKRARTSETSSPQILTLAKKPRFTRAPSPSTQLPLRRSPRKASDRLLAIGSGSPLTVMSPTPSTAQDMPLRINTVTSIPSQVPRRRSAMPPPLGSVTRSRSRDISLPPIRYLGQPNTAYRTHVIAPRLPLSAPPASSAVRLKAKNKPPSIPATCPVPLQALIKTIPESASWLPRALVSILKINVGPKYYRLVELLIKLETLHRFINVKKHYFSSTDRPVVLTKWINSGRQRPAKSCVVGDVGAYAKEWWKWWQTLQPKWRIFDKGGVCVSAVQPESPDAWNCLLVPGANGLLGVVASLYWWGCGVIRLKGKERKEEENGWIKAVEDCAWVMECLVEMMKVRRARNIEGTLETAQDADVDREENEDEDEEDDNEDEEEDELQEFE